MSYPVSHVKVRRDTPPDEIAAPRPPRVEQRRPAPRGGSAGLICDDLLVLVATVVGAAWIVAGAVALTRLTGG